ncbi:MAG: hypothetical protein A2W26_01185 [Acidobacteria bacterium RBG_16_64_8]|nr:MAG: hypothetical protein A2W26_01185 [Acidobacteria bacterium RBG_16_64_8]
MESALGLIAILVVVVLAVAFFVMYLFFKVLEFTINATRLYRQMIRRQDVTIRLLLDIRDNTKIANTSELASDPDGETTAANPTPSPLIVRSLIESEPQTTGQGSAASDDSGEEPDQDTAPPESGEFCYHCGEALTSPTEKCPACGRALT